MMNGFPSLTMLLALWSGITVVLIALVIYRSILGIHEEDQIFLDRSVALLEREQIDTLERIGHVDPLIKGLGWTSGGFLLLITLLWIYRGLYGPIAW